jgi:hypothetical protein
LVGDKVGTDDKVYAGIGGEETLHLRAYACSVDKEVEYAHYYR